ASIWSNSWLVAAVVLAGIGVAVGLVYLVASMLAHESAAIGGADQSRTDDATRIAEGYEDEQLPAQPANEAHSTDEPAFTWWRHTSDGFEASPLMSMANIAMPGFFAAHGREPELNVGVCVGCESLPKNMSSSVIAGKLLDFLRRDPV